MDKIVDRELMVGFGWSDLGTRGQSTRRQAHLKCRLQGPRYHRYTARCQGPRDWPHPEWCHRQESDRTRLRNQKAHGHPAAACSLASKLDEVGKALRPRSKEGTLDHFNKRLLSLTHDPSISRSGTGPVSIHHPASFCAQPWQLWRDKIRT